MSDKKSRKYKSDFGLSDTGSSSKRYDQDEKHRSKKSDKYDDDRKSRSKDEAKKSEKRYDEEQNERSRHRSKAKEDLEYKESRHHRSKYDNDEYEPSKSKHRSKNNDDHDDDRKKSHTKPSKYDDDRSYKESKHRSRNDEKSRSKHKSEYKEDNHELKMSSKKDRQDDKKKKIEEQIVEEEYNYDDDFDDDFESDSEEEAKLVVEKKSDLDDRKSSSKSNESKQSSERKFQYEDKKSKIKYEDYDDYDDYKDTRGRVIKANALVKIPTDSVEVFSSKIYFNHDSSDRQRRRAKDLFKNLIELDAKKFSLLDINPVEMRTAYSAHLRHEKIQTNDDNVEIDCQTDEIEYVTKWTQNPPDDSKGYGTENEKFKQENSDDILEKFRVNINTENLFNFLDKSSKVIEKLIKNDSESSNFKLENSKSDLQISKGFTIFDLPKQISKLFKHYRLTSCTFNQEDANYLVCSYNLPDDIHSEPSLLLVWNLFEPKVPYRVLTCETKSTCLSYMSFMVLSGNLDGSICLWDLRESHSIHSFSSKNKQIDQVNTVRLPTYTTAGVLINENHMSEVRAIINLQNQSDKNVFMQIASLEIEARLIIWTVIEIKNSDLTVFETDLGLLPGGKLKLVKSSQIPLNNIIWSPFGRTEYQTLSMTSSLLQPNHFYIATNIGQIIHINRKGGEFSSSVMKSNYSDSLLIVTDLAFHHEMSDLILSCYANGEIRLYHTSYVTPIKTWNLGCLGRRIKEIKWIESRSSCFSVIDERDCLYLWDLLEDDTQPVLGKDLNEFGGISFSKASLENSTVPFAYFKRDSKSIEIHLFGKEWLRKSEKESKKFSKLIKNYLISF